MTPDRYNGCLVTDLIGVRAGLRRSIYDSCGEPVTIRAGAWDGRTWRVLAVDAFGRLRAAPRDLLRLEEGAL